MKNCRYKKYYVYKLFLHKYQIKIYVIYRAIRIYYVLLNINSQL